MQSQECSWRVWGLLIHATLSSNPCIRNPFAPYRGQNPQNREKRVSESKTPISEQLPCRSAEVKIFSVFLCQRCREIWREILVKFSALRFPGFGCATEISPKCHVKNGVENGKFHANFTLLGRNADPFPATQKRVFRVKKSPFSL